MAHVLVAEDDFEMRWMVVEALRKDGHEVTSVPDGAALLVQIAMTCMPAHSPKRVDVLVSDVRMPGYNALEVLERMDKRRWTLPVILMTAFGDDETRKRAHDLGAILFDKPLSLDALRAEVKRLTAGP
jgi:DNA-binding NtrC family response regulator